MEIVVAVIGGLFLLASVAIQAKMGKKVNETHKQVSENSHKNEKPTVLDLIAELRDEQRVTNRLVVNHINWHLENEE